MPAILELIARRFPEAGISYLIIGGFAVSYYGYTRNTVDVDFMAAADDLNAVRAVMTGAGFVNVSVEDNVVFFHHPSNPLRVDFLRVDKATLDHLLARAIEGDIMGQRVKLPALPDLLALKIFSLSRNTKRRMGKDLPDIAYLALFNKMDFEKDILPLCQRFGNQETLRLVRDMMAAQA